MMPSGWTRKRGSTWTWYIEDVPDPSTGRPRQVSKGGFRTRKEARDAFWRRRRPCGQGRSWSRPSGRSAATCWRSGCRTTSRRGCGPPRTPTTPSTSRTHVVPRLGDIELQRLTPSNLAAFYRALLTDGRRDGQGLAPKTVRNIHAMLHRALKDAVRWGYLVRNVADAVDPPRGASPEHAGLDAPSSCAPSWPMPATIACTPCGCWWPPPGCAAPSWPGCAGSTSTWTPPGSPPPAPGGGQLRGARVRAQDAEGSGPSRWTRPRWRRCRSTRRRQERTRRRRARPGWTRRLVFTRPDGAPIHPDLITDWFRQAGTGPPACRRSACMTSATATPPRRWPPASRPRSSASGWATPTSPSPWTPTATSSPAWTRRPPTTVAGLILDGSSPQKGPDRSPGPPLTND